MTQNYTASIQSGHKTYQITSLMEFEKQSGVSLSRLPYSIRILLENLLRTGNSKNIQPGTIEALAKWSPKAKSEKEIDFTPARVVLQDFTGVPAVVDLAAMRDQVVKMSGEAQKINPLQPVDLVIDHSVQVDAFGSQGAFKENTDLEMRRNKERYQFLRWGQKAFKNFRAVPPGTGIVHQVNLEYLASVVFSKEENGKWTAYPDTVVGTDSHTTMINGLGVLGWGVGGIEAEAAMLGQPISMLIPEVVGFKLKGKIGEGATATDLVLTVTQMLRKKGVVGKFVEFFGPGLSELPLTDRATLANMAPEYGATMGFFPVDEQTLDYLRVSGRSEEQVDLVLNYMKAQKLFREDSSPEPEYSDVLELELESVKPSLAGPKRPQDRVELGQVAENFKKVLPEILKAKGKTGNPDAKAEVNQNGKKFELSHGSVTIAAITSCTNTSNPAVMIGAGLLAKKAVEKGLEVKPWVKTSLAPGSKVVMSYLKKTGVLPYLEKLKFNLVGFGCTTCIGNSGPLPPEIAEAVKKGDLVVASVLSGNRNFEGRVNPLVRANYLASPPLVVAYAIAGTMNIDLSKDPVGINAKGEKIYLKDIWPSLSEVREAVKQIDAAMYRAEYKNVFDGDEAWRAIEVSGGATFQWDAKSTYIKHPPYFENMKAEPEPCKDILGARVLVMVGDSVTTDHISPAGSIAKDGPAAKYLMACGVDPKDFNSYGARRGNHEVMVRGTFANIRLKNLLAPGTEGGVTRHFPDGAPMSIYDAAMQYQKETTPLLVIAGKEYGTGSSRDWAAKGPALLGVRAVLAESYERIHRSNLIGMGILPLEFFSGENRESLGICGEEKFYIEGIRTLLKPAGILIVRAALGEKEKTFKVRVRIDTPVELAYYQHGGILQYVLRQIIKQ